MSTRIVPRRCRAGVLLGLWLLCSAAPTRAESRVEQSESERILLGFRVSDEAARAWLPPGWRLQPRSQGATAGANLFVVLTDRLLELDGNGDVSGGGHRYVGVALPVAPRDGKPAGMLVLRQLSNRQPASTGPYRNTRPWRIDRRARLEASGDGAKQRSERWEGSDDDGGSMAVGLTFVTAVPRRGENELHVYSASDPAVHRIYRIVDATDVLLSTPLGIDRLTERDIAIDLPELRSLLDGSETLVFVLHQPVYRREVFVP